MDPSDRTRHVTGITVHTLPFYFCGKSRPLGVKPTADIAQTYPQLPIMVR
jgi:hypothetical protein